MRSCSGAGMAIDGLLRRLDRVDRDLQSSPKGLQQPGHGDTRELNFLTVATPPHASARTSPRSGMHSCKRVIEKIVAIEVHSPTLSFALKQGSMVPSYGGTRLPPEARVCHVSSTEECQPGWTGGDPEACICRHDMSCKSKSRQSHQRIQCLLSLAHWDPRM